MCVCVCVHTFRIAWMNLRIPNLLSQVSLLSCSAHSPNIIPQNCSSKMSLHCDVAKTLPILVASSYPLDPEQEVALCLKLISVICTPPKFLETLPLDYLALIAARLTTSLEMKENLGQKILKDNEELHLEYPSP